MEKPIRVLQVMGTMQHGGAQQFIMNIYRNIDRKKVQFDFVIHGKENVFEDEIRQLGGNIFQLKYINDIGGIAYKKQYMDFFKEHKYEVVHIHLNQVSGIVAEAAQKSNVKKIIVHSHNTNTKGNILIKAYKKYLGNKINKYSTNNIACGELAGKWLFGKANYEVIYNGIDIEKFKYNQEKRNEIRKELNINNEAVVYGHIGRFAKVKNHIFLIKI